MDTTPELFERITRIFDRAVSMDEPSARAAYLAAACADDLELRSKLDRLIEAHDAGTEFEAELSQRNARPLQISELPYELDVLQVAGEATAQRIRHFEVLEVIGRGGAGIVLKARDTQLNRVVALKMLDPGSRDPSALRRLVREARSAASIIHQHVIAVHAVYEEPPALICMEYVEGPTLQELVRGKGPLSLSDTLRVGIQISEALSVAHSLGIVHRDIKPSNILMEQGLVRAKLADFGLAHAENDANLTATGQLIGTPHYMSPEQTLGQDVDSRTDLFSLGATLYFAYTGVRAFPGDTAIAAIQSIKEGKSMPLVTAKPECPKWFANIVEALLRSKPQERIPDARQLAQLLKQGLAHLEQPLTTAPPEIDKLYRWTIPVIGIPAIRINVFLVATLLYLLLVALLPIGWSWSHSFHAVTPSFFANLRPDIVIPFFMMPLWAAVGTVVLFLAARIPNWIGQVVGIIPLIVVLVWYLAAWFGWFQGTGYQYHTTLLFVFGVQLICVPLALILLIQAIHGPRQALKRIRYSTHDLLVLTTCVGTVMGAVMMLSHTWTGYSLEVSKSVAAFIFIATAAILLDSRFKHVGAELLDRPKWLSRFALATIVLIFLAASAMASRSAQEFGIVELRLHNLPDPATANIQARYTRYSFAIPANAWKRIRLRHGDYRLIVNSPYGEVINEPFDVGGSQSLVLEFDGSTHRESTADSGRQR